MNKNLEEENRILNLMIEEMAKHISNYQDCPFDKYDEYLDCENRCSTDEQIYKECWKMYFRKKCE